MPSYNHFHRHHAREALALPVAVADPAAVVVSVVYVTAAPTFDGPIGGYSTLGMAPSSSPSQAKPIVASTPTPAVAKPAVVKQSSSSPTVASPTSINDDLESGDGSSVQALSALPTEITPTPMTLDDTAAIAKATNSPNPTTALSTAANPTSGSNTASAAGSSATSSASTSSGGMSTGGMAGMAIGILLLLGAILSIVLYCLKKRKENEKEALPNNEKHDDPFADPRRASSIRSIATTRTSETAPRLSLRPVTEFLPNFKEKRASRGNALMTGIPEKSLPALKPESAQSNEVNPFGNHAETIDRENEKAPTVLTSPVIEQYASAPTPSQFTPIPEVAIGTALGSPVAAVPAVTVVAAAAAVPTGLKRGTSKRENAPKHLDFTKTGPSQGPPSPAGTEYSANFESATTPTQTGTTVTGSAVHRVQLDFKPSMDDELELRAGQLIRMLHEYDDGWALCIRLDRSQQGVVPRTCLSTRPVKPRPQQNGSRSPMSPGMNQRGPSTPTSQQSRSGAQSQQSNSPPGSGRMSPTRSIDGPAPLRTPSGNATQRKPVPGQAM